MTVRLQADADLDIDILWATLRRAPDLDFQTADDAGLRGLHDLQVLAIAAQEGRVLVTHDIRTMPYWFAEFTTTATSPGVLMVPQSVPIKVVVDELIMIWVASDASEWVNRICRLPL